MGASCGIVPEAVIQTLKEDNAERRECTVLHNDAENASESQWDESRRFDPETEDELLTEEESI